MSAGAVIFIFSGDPITTATGVAGALDQRRFVGSQKPVRRCLVECFLKHMVAEALRRLCQDHSLPRQSSGNQSTVGCPFDLLDRVDRWQRGNSRTVFLVQPGSHHE